MFGQRIYGCEIPEVKRGCGIANRLSVQNRNVHSMPLINETLFTFQ